MKIKKFKFDIKKIISVFGAFAILVASIPLGAFSISANASTTGNLIDFEASNASAIVEGNDAFSIAGIDNPDKYYFYAKNNTSDTLTLIFDDIQLETGKKYTLDMDIYTLRMSEDSDNKLLGLKVYGANDTSVEADVTNADILEENWANYHTEFTAKDTENKLDFSIFTIGKVFIDNFVLIDENGKEIAIDFATACEATELKDHFSAATLYDIANEEPDIIDGYLKAAVPENSNITYNEGVDIPMNLSEPLNEGSYTMSIDLKFTALGSNRISFCTSIAGNNVSAIQHFLDAEDITLNKYYTYTYDFNLTSDYSWFRLHVFQGCTAYIDNIVLMDAAGQEVVKFDFDEAVSFNGSAFEQKGIAKSQAAMAYSLRNVAETAVEENYAILIDNTEGTGYGKLYLHDVGMTNPNLPAGDYTIEFDFYTLQADSTDLPLQISKSDWSGNALGQKWINVSSTVGEWNTISMDVTTTGVTGYPWFYVGAGLKGYMDNFKIINKSTGEVALNLEFTADDLGKTSQGINTVVALSTDSDEEDTPTVSEDYAILIDNSAGTGYGKLYLHDVGMTNPNLPAGDYTIEFDFYTLQADSTDLPLQISKSDWSGNALGQKWINVSSTVGEWNTISMDVTTTGVIGYPWFYVGAGLKGYMDNFKIISKSTGEVCLNLELTAADLGKSSKTINTVVALPDDVVAAKNPVDPDYMLLVDTTTLDNNSVKDFWFNTLGMASYNNALTSGKSYTIMFDVYPVQMPTGNNLFHYRTSNGNASSNANWWGTSLETGKWQTTSNTFTVGDNYGNHILYVYGGFKGYIDNLRLVDESGNDIEATFTDFNGLTVPTNYADYLTITADHPKEEEEPVYEGDNYTVSYIVDGTGIRTYGSNGVLNYYPTSDTEFTVDGITLESGAQYRLTFVYGIFAPSSANDNAVSIRNVLTDGAHDYIANPTSETEIGTKEYVFTATQTALTVKVYGGCDVAFDNIILEKFTASSATDVAPVELKAKRYTNGADTYIDITVDTTTSAKTFTLNLAYDSNYLEYVSGTGEKASVSAADSSANSLAVTIESTSKILGIFQQTITGEIATLTFKVKTIAEADVTFTADGFTGVTAEILPVTVSFNTRVISLGTLKRESGAVVFGMQLAVDGSGNENIGGELVTEKGFIAAIGYNLDAELALDSYNPYVKEFTVNTTESSGTGYNVYTLEVTEPEVDYPVAVRPYAITANGTYYGDAISASANDLNNIDVDVWAEQEEITSDANLSIGSTAAQVWQGANAISQGFIYANGYTDEQINIELERIDDMDIQMVRSYYDQTYSAVYDAETKTISYDWNTAEMQGLVKWLKAMEERGVEVALNMSWGVGDVYRNHCTTYSYDDCGTANGGHEQTLENAENPFWCVNYELGQSAAVAAYGDWAAESMKYLVDECGLTNVKYLIMFTEPRQDADTTNEWTVYQSLVKSAHDALDNVGMRDNVKMVGPNIALFNSSYAAQLGEEGATYVNDMEDILPLITNYIDIYSFHFYAPNWPADGVTAEDPTDNNYELYAKHFESFISTINKYDSGADYWLDEWNYGGEFIDSPYYATQLTQAVVAALNSGVENVMLWQLFETKWPDRSDTGGEFVNGIHSMGLAPSLTESDVPHDVYYAYTLLTKYMGKSGATVYSGTGDNGIYTAMIENTDGTQSILVVNTNQSAKTVNITVNKTVNGTLLRHLYNPSTVTPSADAIIITADKAFDDVSQGLTDIIPAGGIAVYTTEKD